MICRVHPPLIAECVNARLGSFMVGHAGIDRDVVVRFGGVILDFAELLQFAPISVISNICTTKDWQADEQLIIRFRGHGKLLEYSAEVKSASDTLHVLTNVMIYDDGTVENPPFVKQLFYVEKSARAEKKKKQRRHLFLAVAALSAGLALLFWK